MRRILIPVLMVLALGLGASPAVAWGPMNPDGTYHDPDARLGQRTGWRPGTFMVGDSITWRSYYRMRQQGIDWEITAYPGRAVDTLSGYLADRLANPSPLRTVVIALGTNASPGWTQEDLQDAVGMLPASTRVVLVTTYRGRRYTAAHGYDYRSQAWVQGAYSAWERALARSRPHTCVAPWRAMAEHHHGYMIDAIHPYGRGLRAWVDLVQRTTRGCR